MVNVITLTEFLTARLDEDEAAAREFDGGHPRGECDSCDAASRVRAFGEARWLAEVRAKTIILSHAMTLMVTSHARGQDDAADGILFALALPYADHPDYRDEWRP